MLHRIVEPYEIHKCDYSGELIIRGEYYYRDTEDGFVIKSSEYHNLKMAKKKETFDYTLLQQAESQLEYESAMKLAEKEFLSSGILERDIAVNGRIKSSEVDI